jgi:hypothetical protein
MGVWRRTYNKRITVLDLNLGDLTKRFKQSLEIMPLRVVANIANKEFGKRHGARAREGGRSKSKSKRETREMVQEEDTSLRKALHSSPPSFHSTPLHSLCIARTLLVGRWLLLVTPSLVRLTLTADNNGCVQC